MAAHEVAIKKGDMTHTDSLLKTLDGLAAEDPCELTVERYTSAL